MAIAVNAATGKSRTANAPLMAPGLALAARATGNGGEAPFDWVTFFADIAASWPERYEKNRGGADIDLPLARKFAAESGALPALINEYADASGYNRAHVAYFSGSLKIMAVSEWEGTKGTVDCGPQEALAAAITARLSYPAMADNGIRLTADTPRETALSILACRRMGLLIVNEKELMTRETALAMDLARDEWDTFIQSPGFAAAFAPHAQKLTTPTAALLNGLDDILVNGNAGEYMIASGMIDRKTYDERGLAQARLVALRSCGKVPESELAELLKPQNYKHAHAKFLGLGLGDAEIAAAQKYIKDNNGANAKDEKIKVPLMGEIGRAAFPGFDAKEQAALALQHYVRAMETLDGGIPPEKLAEQLKNLPRKKDSGQLKAIIAIHRQANEAVAKGEKDVGAIRSALAGQAVKVKELFLAAGAGCYESAVMYARSAKRIPVPAPAAKTAP